MKRWREWLQGKPGAAAPVPAPSPAAAPPADPYASMRHRYTHREGFIVTDLVAAGLPPAERFTILDGGAREALADPRWRAIERGRVRLYGFEPDEREVTELNRLAAEAGLDYRYYAQGLWSETTTRTFYENKSPGGGAFYAQNVGLTDRWKFANTEAKFASRDIFYPTKTASWSLTSVRDWAGATGVEDIDFAKLNVQGAELEILRGFGPLLDTVSGLMVEVSFVESYLDRPFFADIDVFVRAAGFHFFDLIGHHYMGRERSPITARHAPGLYPLWGQLIEGHAIYLRDPIETQARTGATETRSLVKLMKLACFAEIFGQVEYTLELLEWIAAHATARGDRDGAAWVRTVLATAEDRYRHITGGWAALADPATLPPRADLLPGLDAS